MSLHFFRNERVSCYAGADLIQPMNFNYVSQKAKVCEPFEEVGGDLLCWTLGSVAPAREHERSSLFPETPRGVQTQPTVKNGKGQRV